MLTKPIPNRVGFFVCSSDCIMRFLLRRNDKMSDKMLTKPIPKRVGFFVCRGDYIMRFLLRRNDKKNNDKKNNDKKNNDKKLLMGKRNDKNTY